MSKAQVKTDESGISRRTFMKASAGAVGVATVGGTSMHSDRLAPVGDAEAIPVGPAIVAGAFAAGLYIEDEFINPTNDVDPDGDLQDQLYFAADTMADATEEDREDLRANYVEPSSSATPYAELAWSEITTSIARSRVNGLSETEALAEAQDALEEQTTRSVINMTEAYNSDIKALMEQFVYDYEDDIGVFSTTDDGEDLPRVPDEDETRDDSEPVDGSMTEDGPIAYRVPVDNLPIEATELDGRDEPLTAIHVGYNRSDNGFTTPFRDADWCDPGLSNHHYDILADHGDFEQRTAVPVEDYNDVFDQIESAYQNIYDDLQTYTETMYQSFEEGVLDPAEIITPSELYSDFATSDAQSRMAAELMTVGAAHPGADNIDFRVEVSHPDMESDSLWGQLYPQFEEDAEVEISAGTTIEPEDYRMAYFGFHASDTGEWTQRVFSGDEPLEILDAEDLDTDTIVDDETVEGMTAGDGGEVTVWDEATDGEAPDALQYPNDHEGWYVDVQGASNLSRHDVSEVVETNAGDDLYYYLDTTDLNDGESVERIGIKSPVSYSQTSQRVADPTEIDEDRVERQVQQYQDLHDALEELDEGGNLGSGGLIPSGFGITSRIQQIVGVFLLFILGLFGLSAASG